MVVYPNPAQDMIRLDYPGNIDILRTEIYNNEGKTILNDVLLYPKKTINVGHLPAGLYIIKSFTINKTLTSKFIINH